MNCELVIVGGGIVGLATALASQRRGIQTTVLEAEPALSRHQTGRNSGVIHAGVYYAPGSLKARFCRLGAARMVSFCQDHGVPHEICGKLIVATSDDEVQSMNALHVRALQNGIEISALDTHQARQLEPQINARAALLSPSTGIVDYAVVAEKLAELLIAAGGTLRLDARVVNGSESDKNIRLSLSDGTQISAERAVFCAGLWADRMALMMGINPEFRVIPFRGEYFRIDHQPSDLVSHLIYPVPDPERPFLGIHLTKKMDGGFTVGPNAVLAGARDGYRRRDINLRDLADSSLWPGFWRMLRANAGPAADEVAGSLSKRLYLRKVRRYCPQIGLKDLSPYRTGIRAQAVGRDGRLIDDFLFLKSQRALHVCNAPSPAATACLPIADHIIGELLS